MKDGAFIPLTNIPLTSGPAAGTKSGESLSGEWEADSIQSLLEQLPRKGREQLRLRTARLPFPALRIKAVDQLARSRKRAAKKFVPMDPSFNALPEFGFGDGLDLAALDLVFATLDFREFLRLRPRFSDG